MKNLINKIELLENKRNNGTITMTEDATLVKLTDLATKFLGQQILKVASIQGLRKTPFPEEQTPTNNIVKNLDIGHPLPFGRNLISLIKDTKTLLIKKGF